MTFLRPDEPSGKRYERPLTSIEGAILLFLFDSDIIEILLRVTISMWARRRIYISMTHAILDCNPKLYIQ
jgi:hypothetical protein